MKSLNKKEYHEILKSQIGSVPNTSNSVEDVRKARTNLSK